MNSTYFRYVIWICIAGLLLTAFTSAPLQANDERPTSSQEIWIQFHNLISQDETVHFKAKRELLAIGEDVIPYALEKVNRVDDEASVVSGFLLGEIRGGKAIPVLLQILRESKFTGEDADPGAGEQGTEIGSGPGGPTKAIIMTEKARAYRDGFACLSLAIQASHLDLSIDENITLVKVIRLELQDVLTNEEKKHKTFVKACAILALGLVNDKTLQPMFAEMALNKGKSVLLRVASILTLSRMPNDLSRETLTKIMEIAPEKKWQWKINFLKKNAVLGLANMNDASCLNTVMLATQDLHSPAVRGHAWLSLGEMNLLEALPDLQLLVGDEENKKVLASAARAFYQLGDHEMAYSILEHIIYDKTSPVSTLIYATQILGSFTDLRAKDALVKMLNHSNTVVQQYSVANLVKFSGDPQVRSILSSIVTNKRADSIQRKQAALGFMNWDLNDSDINILVRTLKSKDADLRRCAVLALVYRAPERNLLAALNGLLRDKDTLVQSYAALVFGSCAWDLDEKQYSLIKNLQLKSKSRMVRRDADLAMQAITNHSHAPIRDDLKEFLRRESLAPQFIWEEFWQHQFELVLTASLASAAEANNLDEVEIKIVEVEPSPIDPGAT